MSPKWEYKARRRIERKRDVYPCRRLGQMMRPLTIRSWRKTRGRGCNAGEFCARRLFFFSGCTWKSTGGVHAVCMRGDDWEILGVQETWLSWMAIDCALFSSYQVFFQMSDAPTWVSRIQILTQRIALRTVTETLGVYAMCTVGGDDVRTLTIQETRLSCRSNCGLFFFWSTLQYEQCSNLSLDDPNPMNHTKNSPKRRQEKQRFARRKHWNHKQVTDRPRPDAPSLTQTIIVQMDYCKPIFWCRLMIDLGRQADGNNKICLMINLGRQADGNNEICLMIDLGRQADGNNEICLMIDLRSSSRR